MPFPLDSRAPPYQRGDLVRCACGNPFVAGSAHAECARCGGHDVRPLSKPPPAKRFRF